jgi:hypothetical protein
MTDWKCLQVGVDITTEEFHKEITKDPYFSLSTPEKIEEFKKHPKGWDFGVGDPAPPPVADEALALHEFGAGMGLKTDASPCTNGGIAVTFYRVGSDESVEITVNTNLTYDLLHEKGIGWNYDTLMEAEDFALTDVKNYIKAWVPLPPMKEGEVVT